MCCGAFFRTPGAFTALKAWVVEDLLDCATPDNPARIWIPACGTGEEAYSVAMLLIEHFQAYGRQANLRVFATDTETNSIEVARAGVYAESDVIGVSAPRLQRFFQHYGSNRLQVSAGLRDCVVFAHHDLQNDPPLSRLDFVNCQNALGQLAAGNRTNLYSLLHFALSLLQVLRFVLPLAEEGSRDRERAGQCCRCAPARRKLSPTFCPKRFALHQFQCL